MDQSSTNQADFITSADELLGSCIDQECSHVGMELGENQSPEHTADGVGDFRVALFFKLVRNLSSDQLDDLLQPILNKGNPCQDDDLDSEKQLSEMAEYVADAFLIAFQTRNCRGGKGERALFYQLITRLVVAYPHTLASLMSLVPNYGTYKDWFFILQIARDEKNTPEYVRVALRPTCATIMNLVRDQLLHDQNIMNTNSSVNDMEKNTKKISLLCKWVPREGKALGTLVKDLASHIFPMSRCPKKDYRILIASLNKALHTTEILMSSDRWDEIRLSSVPSVCMMKNRKAFLNEKVKGSQPTDAEMETGNRHPENEKRVTCRKRLIETLLDERGSKIKGRQLYPHEIVMKYDGFFSNISDMESLLFQKQWDDIRNSVIRSMEEKKATQFPESNNSSNTIKLGNLLPVVDVSGSMNGDPMEVAIALGILTSELVSPAFAHRIITFSESPSWIVLSSEMKIGDKVKLIREAPWGYNTDFEKVMNLILSVAKEGNLSPEQIPDLLVLSDMQFDEASSGGTDCWETQHERIVRRFKESGVEVCGREWPCPSITYWNLRGDIPRELNALWLWSISNDSHFTRTQYF